MAKLHYIYLMTTVLILSLNTVGMSDAKGSIISSKQKSSYLSSKQSKVAIQSIEAIIPLSQTATKDYKVAQAATTKPKADTSDTEMLDALQKRQDKIEQNLGKIKKLTGADSTNPEMETTPMTDDEMIGTLQEKDFNIDSLEDLEAIQTIVNDESLESEQMLDALQQHNFNVDNLKKLKQLRKIVKTKSSGGAKYSGISSPMAFKMLTIGIPFTILVFLIATPFAKGIVGAFKSNYQEKFGKPKVPEGSINLHSRSFKEITLIGNKAEKINNDKFGLKLLALFKQYELQDFSILKNVSDIVESLKGKDLIESNDLVSPVLEHYESFEKLGSIIGISEAESTPQAYAKILQVISLTNRHGKAYLEFGQLVELLKKWEKPYKAIALVRKEYTEDKYSIPTEFKEDIPGVKVYQRYVEYLPDL